MPNKPQQQRKTALHSIASASEPTPVQVATLVHRNILEQFHEQMERPVLISMFGSHPFQEFCRRQLDAVGKDIGELSPDRFSPEQFFQLSKDMRLLSRFWKDLLSYAEEFKPQENRAQ